VIKYLGSKRVLLPAILDVITRELPDARTALDVFAGTSRVGHALKRHGLRVLANDHNAYAHTLARCYVEADDDVVDEVRGHIEQLMAVPPRAGWLTRTYCEQSRFFHPDNGARIDAIRDAIDTLDVTPVVRAVLLVSLMEAADRVDSTVGVQMAYLKSYASRALKPLQMRVPELLPRSVHGAGEAHQLDATMAVSQLAADVVYLDPPYNQHSYLGNYHIWESLVLWDHPEVYGKACKRIDVRARKSPYNRKTEVVAAMRALIHAVQAKLLVVSFNNEGFLSRTVLEELLRERGHVDVVQLDHARYVGARIGIHNPKGERVGVVSHTRNHEYLYVVKC
jgi:adenine-specific DNA-methyltransferase